MVSASILSKTGQIEGVQIFGSARQDMQNVSMDGVTRCYVAD